jgi:hypothetical protein
MQVDYKQKYLKYKGKYEQLKQIRGGGEWFDNLFSNKQTNIKEKFIQNFYLIYDIINIITLKNKIKKIKNDYDNIDKQYNFTYFDDNYITANIIDNLPLYDPESNSEYYVWYRRAIIQINRQIKKSETFDYVRVNVKLKDEDVISDITNNIANKNTNITVIMNNPIKKPYIFYIVNLLYLELFEAEPDNTLEGYIKINNKPELFEAEPDNTLEGYIQNK